jgi:CheY-like chemotaxis protein
MIMGPSVMLVDDVLESQESSAAVLTGEGYEVSLAAGVEEALRSLSKRQPDAVLFQIMEPANGAIDFVRRLALSTHARFVPVVVLIAPNKFQLERSLSGMPGVRRILYSPGPPEVLRTALSHAVRYSREKGGDRE